MEPLRHSLVTFALALASALGAPAGEAHASCRCADTADAPPGDAPGAREEAAAAEKPGVSTAVAEPVPAVLRPEPAAETVALSPGAAAPPPDAVGSGGASSGAGATGEVPPAPAPGADPPGRTVQIALPLELEVHGRVITGISADERSGWGRTFGVGSARLGLEARFAGVKTVVEADLASSPIVEDAFVRLDGPGATRLVAGRFKAPFSERRSESSWRLPLVDRGLVDQYLVKRNGLGGRRLGVAGGLRAFGERLEVAAGAFAGDPDALEAGTDAGEDLAARVSLRRLGPVELGVSGYRAGPGTGLGAAPARHAAGAFANVRLGPLEAALEGFAGRVADGPFTAGTALVGWELGGEGRRLRITPVAGVEALELRGATSGVGYGAIAGAVISWAKGIKVKVQGEWARRPGDAAPASAVAAEVGTRF